VANSFYLGHIQVVRPHTIYTCASSIYVSHWCPGGVKDTNGKGKGNLFALHTMKAHSWSRDIAPLILNQGTLDVSKLTSRSGRFNIVNKPWYPLNMRLGGQRSRSGRSGEKKIFLPTPGFEHRTHLSYLGSRGHKIYTNLKRHNFNAKKTKSKNALFLHIVLNLRRFNLLAPESGVFLLNFNTPCI
jgi:hypothetical protein